MSKLIHCKKLNDKKPSLENPPFPGPLGEQIMAEISAEAWQLWLDRQVMIINEYRLNTRDPKSREFLEESMKKFLFENDDSMLPPGYEPPS
ncbi:MAG: oxidative damage protection protein [Pseudomonadota bacterium]|nr:oxidative damage protection protein [Pseudomonadota bacterium]